MTRNDPNHPKRIHHGWNGINDGQQTSSGNVFEMPLEGRQKFDIVLSFQMQLVEFPFLNAENWDGL